MRSVLLRTSTIGATIALGLVTAACSGPSFLKSDSSSSASQSASASAKPKAFAGLVSFNVKNNDASVAVSTMLTVSAAKSTLQEVTAQGPGGPVPGDLSEDGLKWAATGSLRPDVSYTITAVAIDGKGLKTTQTRTFKTANVDLDQLTYPSFIPADGAVVGIAMPVIIRFDVPVTKHEEIQKHLVVTTVPAQEGGWHWVSDNEVHWRPKTYWQAGTKVHVEANIAGIPAAEKVWGQKDRSSNFTIGRSQIIKVNIKTHELNFYRDGQMIKTLPITAGREPAYTTRSGTKVIVEKLRYTNMNSETVGISNTSSEGYDLKNVEYAMRLTYSGEFFHAAPWSVASQGHANVSHGCTGLSTANAKWLFDNSLIGDPAEFTGTTRQMTADNGYGDWNVAFDQYIDGTSTDN